MTLLARRTLLWLLPVVVLGVALYGRVHGFGDHLAPMRDWLFNIFTRLDAVDKSPLSRPSYAPESEIVFFGLAGLGIIFLFARERIVGAGLAALAAIIAAIAASWWLYVHAHLAFDPAYPVCAITAIFAAGLLVYFTAGARERTRLRRALAAHLPPAAMTAVVRNPEILKLSGETRTMTYLSCSIRGYTKLVESFANEPEELARLTRRVITPLADAILARKGAIDRLSPGGLTAFFNAPLDDPEHAVHACEAALRMTEALEHVNRGFDNERRNDGTALEHVTIGIGIASGPAVAGNFGTERRLEYSVAGRVPMLAERFARMSAQYGPAIMVGDATRVLAERNFAFLEVDLLAIGEEAEPMKLFALLGNPLVRASPKFRAMQTFHDHIFASYRAKSWDKARALIEQCRALSSASPELYDLYEKRMAFYQKQPPGELWNGAEPTPLP